MKHTTLSLILAGSMILPLTAAPIMANDYSAEVTADKDTVDINAQMSQKDIDAIINAKPKTIVMSTGDYTKFTGLKTENADVIINGNVTVDSLTMVSGTLKGAKAGSTLTVNKELNVENTNINKTDLTLFARDENTKFVLNRQTVAAGSEKNPLTYPEKTATLNDKMTPAQIDEALKAGAKTVTMTAGDYTKFTNLNLADTKLVIEGKVTVDKLVLNNVQVIGAKAGSELTVNTLIEMAKTTIDSANLTVKAKDEKTTAKVDGKTLYQGDANNPLAYPVKIVFLNDKMTAAEIDEALDKGPETIALAAGDYTRIAELDLEDLEVLIDGNVTIKDMNLENCTLAGKTANSVLNVTSKLWIAKTKIDDKDLTLKKANDKALIYIDGKLVEDKPEEVSGKWVTTSAGRYKYQLSDGSFITSQFAEIGNDTYYFDSDSIMVTGWKEIDKQWYYFDTAGHMKKDWLKLYNVWYCFNSNGIMQTGWVEDKGQKYYLDDNGKMLASTWLKQGKDWYYLDSAGAMKTGWLRLDGTWYYLQADGVMAANTTIDGYHFTASGACTNPYNQEK